MFFEIFTLLFHTKSVRNDLSVLLILKNICKESSLAYQQTRSTIFVNALMVHKSVVEFGYIVVEYGLEPEYFTEILNTLSETLLMYEDPYTRMWPPILSNTQLMVEDPFYPDKTKIRPGQVLRFRKRLQENKYLDSIINLASKPKKTIIY